MSKSFSNLSHTLLGDSFLTLAIRIMGLILQVGVFALITRTNSLETVGLYAIVNSGWVLARFLGPMGYDRAALRFVSQFFEEQQNDKVAAFSRFATRKILRFIVPVSLVLVVSAIAIAVNTPVFTPTAQLVILFAAGLPAYALGGLIISLLRASGDIPAAQLPDAILMQVLLGAGVLALVQSGIINIIWLLAIQVVAVWLVLGIYILAWRRVISSSSSDPMDKKECRDISTMTRSVIGGLTVTALAASAPVLLISITLGPPAAALMEAARRFGLLAGLSTWAVGVAVSPLMARAHKRSDHRQLQNLLTISSILQTLPALIILAGLVIFGQWLLMSLLGSEFEAAYGAMVLMAIAMTINASGSAASSFLVMAGGEKTVLHYSLASLLIIVSGIPLIALISGLTTATSVLIVASIVRDLGMTIFVARHHELHPGIWSLSELSRMGRLLPQLRKMLG